MSLSVFVRNNRTDGVGIRFDGKEERWRLRGAAQLR